MKYKILFLLISIACVSANAQKIDRNLLYGRWKIKGVLIRNELIGFWQPDTLVKKLLLKRKIEQPGVAIPTGDSIAIEMGAHFLCQVLNNLELQISKPNEILFQFAEGKEGNADNRNHVLQFTFKNDTALATVDEKGYKSDLKIEKLSPTILILSGISSARYMQLYFKRE